MKKILTLAAILFISYISLNASDLTKITPSDTKYLSFGSTFDVDGDWMVVGAPFSYQSIGVTTGKVYIYKYQQETGWKQHQVISQPNGVGWTYAGNKVAISGNRLIFNAPMLLDNRHVVYVYEYDEQLDTWVETSTIELGDIEEDYVNLEVDGDEIYISNFYADNNNFDSSGEVYVYKKNGQSWNKDQLLTAGSEAQENLYFGYNIECAQNYLAVACFKNLYNNIIVLIFEKNNQGNWELFQTIKDINPNNSIAQFEGSNILDFDGDNLVVSLANSNNQNSGVIVYSFDGNQNKFIEEATLNPDNSNSELEFGIAPSLYNNRVLVTENSTNVFQSNSSVYLFDKTPSGWEKTQKYDNPPDLQFTDNFGFRTRLTEDHLIISSPGKDLSSTSGALYYIKPPDPPEGIAYIIPDIGTPNMNTYIEIIGSVNENNLFPPDGLYYDTYIPEDADGEWHLVVRTMDDADTNKITFGPCVVSWDGRMISTQAFINPNLEPNDWDYSKLDEDKFVVDIVVEALAPDGTGYVSISQKFYIVQPFPFPDYNSTDFVLGEGPFGKRSPRGAMIVDNMTLGNAPYTVSSVDCDPDTPGNQAWLPFVLLSKGDINGEANTIIDLNGGYHGALRNAAPGGGGGGGSFQDVPDKGAGGTDGGSGYTSGGQGGSNWWRHTGEDNLGRLNNLGESTGEDGASLNNVSPGVTYTFTRESAGGGTGHPYGKSGEGSSGDRDKLRYGQYGGGSGYGYDNQLDTDDTHGGAGGYATVGWGDNNNQTGGKIHGNSMGVPLAGGSGGASGNPKAIPILNENERAGSGGGGGGGIRIFAQNINNIELQAIGADGETPSGPDGGSGSGGFVMVNTKLSTQDIDIDVSGGTVGSRAGGAGRIRYDCPPTGFDIAPSPSEASLFRGITTDTTNFIDRIFSITGSKDRSETIKVFIKPENGLWEEIAEITDNSYEWSIDDYTLPGDDDIYYLCVLQKVTDPSSEQYTAEPSWVMSQSAANILILEKYPEIVCSDIVDTTMIECIDKTIQIPDTIRNIGEGPLAVYATTNDNWQNGNKGFSIVGGNFPELEILPNEFYTYSVNFTYTGQQRDADGKIRDTLFIHHNDEKFNSDKNPWPVVFEVELVPIDIKLYKLKYTPENEITNEFDFGFICQGSINSKAFIIENNNNYDIEISDLSFLPDDAGYNIEVLGKYPVLPAGDTTLAMITLSAGDYDPAETTIEADLIIKIKECPTYERIITVIGEMQQSDLAFDPNPLNFPNTRVNLSSELDVTLRNDGPSAAKLEVSSIPNFIGDFQVVDIQPPLPQILNIGDELTLTIRFTPTSEGLIEEELDVQSVLDTEIGSCPEIETLQLSGTGVQSSVYLSKVRMDFDTLAICETDLDTLWIKNPGKSSADFDLTNFDINGKDAICFEIVSYKINDVTIQLPYTMEPSDEDSVAVIVRFSPDKAINPGYQQAALIISTDLPSPEDSYQVDLTGYFDPFDIEYDPTNLAFGDIEIGYPKQATFTITNIGLLDRRVKSITAANPDVTIDTDPSGTVIAGEGGEETFSMTWNASAGTPEGTITTVISVEFDEPCEEISTYPANANVLYAEYDLAETLDLGSIANCETSERILELINNGLARLKVLELGPITGDDADLFYIDNTQTLPYDLSPGTFPIKVVFDPQGADDGVKNAVLEVKLLVNGEEITEQVQLSGEMKSLLISFPNPVDFGKVVVGQVIPAKTLTITNNNDFEVEIIEEVLPGIYPGVFIITPDPLGITIPAHDTQVFQVEFTPNDEILFEDKLRIKIRFESCEEWREISIIGDALPSLVVELDIPELENIEPYLDNYTIPIYGRLIELENDEETLDGFDIETVEIRFDRSLFYPKSVSPGEITSISLDGNMRVIQFSIPNISISGTDSENKIIAEITGSTMLGNSESTMIYWSAIDYSENMKVSRVDTLNGSFDIEICEGPDGEKRLLEVNNVDGIIPLPNPTSGNTVLEVNMLEKGSHKIEIMDLTGRRKIIDQWFRNIDDTTQRFINFDASNYSSGVYYLIYSSPSRQRVAPLYIVK